MDKQETIRLDDFKELAKEMLCTHKHNCSTYPDHNRVGEVSKGWADKYEAYEKLKSKHVRSIPEHSQATKVVSTKISQVRERSDQGDPVVKKMSEAHPHPITALRTKMEESNHFIHNEAVTATASLRVATNMRVTPVIATQTTVRVNQDVQYPMAETTANAATDNCPGTGDEGLTSSGVPLPCARKKHETGDAKQTTLGLPLQSSIFGPPPANKPLTTGATTTSKQGSAIFGLSPVSTRENIRKVLQPQTRKSSKLRSQASGSASTHGAQSAFDAKAEEPVASLPDNFSFSFNISAWTGQVIGNSKSSLDAIASPMGKNFINSAEDVGARESRAHLLVSTLSSPEDLPTADAKPSLGRSDSKPKSGSTSESGVGDVSLPLNHSLVATRIKHPSSKTSIKTTTATKTTSEPLISSESPLALPEIEVSHQEKSLTQIPQLSSELPKPPPLSPQKPLPPFNLGFIPRSPNLRPRARGTSSGKSNISARPLDSGSRFVFGSEYKEPPTTFDFKKWSQLSNAGRFPDPFLVGDGFVPKTGHESIDASERLVEGEVELPIVESSQIEIDSNAMPPVGSAPVTLPELPETPPTPIDRSGSSAETLKTPTKTLPTVQKYGLLTPEETPESVNVSVCSEESAGNSEAFSEFIDAKAHEAETSLNEGNDAKLESAPLTPLPDSPPLPTRQESFGNAVIEPPALFKKTHIVSKSTDALLTPSASPEPRRDSQHIEAESPSRPSLRWSFATHLKPVPSPEQTNPSIEPDETIRESRGQSVHAEEEQCRRIDQDLRQAKGEWTRRRLEGAVNIMRREAASKVARVEAELVRSLEKIRTRLEVGEEVVA